jgi:hypothetical protein
MSAYDVEEARRLVRQLEDREAARVGQAGLARVRVAHRLGVSPGSLERLRRGRLKTVGARVRDRLKAAVVKELQDEIHKLEHELEMVRLRGRPIAADEMAQAQKLLDQAKRLIEMGSD